MADECPTVAIVGGGCSGVLTAAHLLSAGMPSRVVLLDRGPFTGRGAAYGNRSASLVLNVPASGMSAFPDDPGHFARWAAARHGDAHPHAFLPRHLYGAYLAEVLDAAEAAASGVARLTHVKAETTAVMPSADGDGVVLGLRDGRHLEADKVVLALGNFAPATPKAVDPALISGERYAADPWAPGALDSIGAADDVLLIGTGLTAVDVALLLAERGHTGNIHAVSRRGLLPHPHLDPPPPARTVTLPATGCVRSARSLLAAIRDAARAAERRGEDWRPIVDGLRPVTQQLWRSLPDDERRVFVRRMARYWDVHRHRMAPSVAAAVGDLRNAGRLTVSGGFESVRLTGQRCEARFRQAPAARLPFDRVVNCTGPRCDVAGVSDPLVRSLLARGLARPGPLGLGFDVDDDGALLDAAGHVSATLFTVGPLRKGALWETTAVPEIAAQAAALSGVVVRRRQPEPV